MCGKIRDCALTLSENDIQHWILLMFADRVNFVVGIRQDLREGHIPNILGERGNRVELEHNPLGLATEVRVTASIIGLLQLSRSTSD